METCSLLLTKSQTVTGILINGTSRSQNFIEDWTTNTWFKVMSQKSQKYIARRALKDDIPAPDWPDQKTFMEYLLDSVRDRFIDSMEHSVVKAPLALNEYLAYHLSPGVFRRFDELVVTDTEYSQTRVSAQLSCGCP